VSVTYSLIFDVKQPFKKKACAVSTAANRTKENTYGEHVGIFSLKQGCPLQLL